LIHIVDVFTIIVSLYYHNVEFCIIVILIVVSTVDNKRKRKNGEWPKACG